MLSFGSTRAKTSNGLATFFNRNVFLANTISASPDNLYLYPLSKSYTAEKRPGKVFL